MLASVHALKILYDCTFVPLGRKRSEETSRENKRDEHESSNMNRYRKKVQKCKFKR